MNAALSRLFSALVYPRTLDDYVELAPLASLHRIRARIVDVRRETHDVATLELEPNARWRGHRAGQHVALTVSIDGKLRTRCFSIASREDASERRIAITVKARPGGTVTPRLVSGELRGAVVELSPATGDFVLPAAVPRILLVSGGSGITPVMAMLRTIVAGRGAAIDGAPPSPPRDVPVTFVHYARSEADVIYRDELGAIARAGIPGVAVKVFVGPFEPRVFASEMPDFDRWDTWACGPEPFLDALKRTFQTRDAETRVRTERFSLDLGPRASTENDVSFVRSQRRSRGGGSLLAMAEAAGVDPPSGCRMGICHTCVCRKVSGVTKNLRTGELSTDDGVDIQLCISEPVGPVALDI